MLVVLLGSTGCYKVTFIVPGALPGEQQDRWTSFFLWGLVGEQHIDVREFCRGPVAMVRTGANFGTGLVSVLTLGIYSPRKVYVTCAANSAAQVSAAVDPSVEITLDDKGRPIAVRDSNNIHHVLVGTPVPGEHLGEWKVALREEARQ